MKKALVILMILALAAPAMAGKNWDGTGNWTDTTGMWSGDYSSGIRTNPPDNGQQVNIRSGENTYSTGTFTTTYFYMGHPGTADSPGTPGDAEFNMTGGTITTGASNNFVGVGDNNSSMDFNLSGSASFNTYYLKMIDAPGASQANTTCDIILWDTATLSTSGEFHMGSNTGTVTAGNVFNVELNDTSVLTAGWGVKEGQGLGTKTLKLNGGTLVVLSGAGGASYNVPNSIWVTGLGGAGGVWGMRWETPDGTTYTAWQDAGTSDIYYQGVPEPATMLVLALGGIAFLAARRRR